jgi:TRAP-type C4-dicarboxylate transport system permease small subunit
MTAPGHPRVPAADTVLEKVADEFAVPEEPVDLSQYGFEDWVALGLFWALALVIFYQFFTRYALNDSASWTEEIARYLLIGVAFVGAAMNTRKNNHIHVDFLYRLVPRWVGRPLSNAVDIARIAFLGYCVWLTYLMIGKIGASRMAIVDLPMGLVYGVVMFGFALMTVRAIQVAWGNWKRGYSVLERPELADTPTPVLPSPPFALGEGRGEAR